MQPMLAYHSDQAIKSKYLDRVKAHQKADELVKGQYWEGGKGCAVGCTIHSGRHASYEAELGIPQVLARLEDRIFEGLPNAKAKTWPSRFLTSIKPGANLNGVGDKFLAWLVRDLLRFAKKPDTIKAINTVADLYDRRVLGEVLAVEMWKSARSASAAAAAAAYASADAAAAAAAYDASASASADAASADAADAAAAAADAPYAAYDASASADAAAAAAAAYAAADAAYAAYAAAYDARKNHYVLMADKLLELLKAAK